MSWFFLCFFFLFFLRVRETFGTLWAESHRCKSVLYFLLSCLYCRRRQKSLKVCGEVRVACSDFVSCCEGNSAVLVDFPSHLFFIRPASSNICPQLSRIRRSSGRDSSLFESVSTFTANYLPLMRLNLTDASPSERSKEINGNKFSAQSDSGCNYKNSALFHRTSSASIESLNSVVFQP